jgi:hypothetical protein
MYPEVSPGSRQDSQCEEGRENSTFDVRKAAKMFYSSKWVKCLCIRCAFEVVSRHETDFPVSMS